MTIAKRLKEAQDNAAMLTTFNEVDMTAIYALREKYKEDFKSKHGLGLGFMSFFTKAVTEALKHFPKVNSMIDGDEIVSFDYADISIAGRGEQFQVRVPGGQSFGHLPSTENTSSKLPGEWLYRP